MSELLELAERCERATGPDRELDAEIWMTVHPEWRDYPRNEFGGWDTPLGATAAAPAHTSSIDAAMTLVPEHFSSELTSSSASVFTRCRLWDWRRSPTMSDPGNEWKSEGNRPLPLSICAASIRAINGARG